MKLRSTYGWLAAMLWLHACPVHAQEQAFPVKYHFNWKKVEQHVPASVVDQFIKGKPAEFEYFRRGVDKYHSANLDTLATRLHFLDLNGDGRLDIIFDGESGGEGKLLLIFMNVGGKYKRVFSNGQYISSMEWRENRLYKLYITDPGCCDEYRNFNKIYQAEYDKGNLPTFVKLYQSEFVKQTTFPDTLLGKPVRFEVLNDHYKLRFAPVIDDSSEQIWGDDKHPPSGNLIGKLAKGAQGTAIARETDATGREWWYVEMDEAAYPSGEVLGRLEENDFPTKAIGWISSRFVKVLP